MRLLFRLFRWAIALFALIVAFLLVLLEPAFAEGVAKASADPLVDISTVVAIISGTVIPFIVDLVTKSRASKAVKSTVAAVLAVLAGVLPSVAFDPSSGWKAYIFNIVLAFLTAMGVHRTGISDPVQEATADTGIGQPVQGTITGSAAQRR